MSKRVLRHAAEYAAYLAARWIIGHLPLSAVRRAGHALGLLYYALGREHRRRAIANLELTLPGPHEQHVRIARDCFRSYGAIFFETAHAYGRDPQRFQQHFDVQGLEHLEAADALGRGCILVAGHFGNWELALWPLGRRLGQIHVVARPVTNPRVDRDVRRMRARLGHELLPLKGAGLRMRNVLRARGRVAIVIDQRVKPRNGILIPFLGRPAWLTPMVAALSIHGGVPVVPVFCVPVGSKRYAVNILPPILPEGLGLAAETAMARRYLEPLEQHVRQRPELWLWMHRLWRLTQREGLSEQRMLNRRLSGLPPGDLDNAPPPPELRDAICRLTADDWLERADNAVVVTGREAGTRLARSVAGRLLEAGQRIRYSTPRKIAFELAAARAASELARELRELDTCDLLILDGLGSVALEAGEVRELLQLFEQRRGRRSMLVTTDVAVGAWERIFGDAATAGAVRRTLIDGAILLEPSGGEDV